MGQAISEMRARGVFKWTRRELWRIDATERATVLSGVSDREAVVAVAGRISWFGLEETAALVSSATVLRTVRATRGDVATGMCGQDYVETLDGVISTAMISRMR